jgi:hypothetical protein
MTDRSSLGSADVPDDALAGMVADLLGHETVELESVVVDPVAYDVPSLTTVGRWWVSGTARTPVGHEPFRLFVKHVQAWHHSPYFQLVPEPVRELAKASYPWDVEAAAYRSDLRDRLPRGLEMPRAFGVFELEPDAVVLWLESVDHPPARWDAARFERAAHLLGRLAGSERVRALGSLTGFVWSPMNYVVGRVLHDVVPRVTAEESWQDPDVQRCFGGLKARLQAECDRIEERGAELVAMPVLPAHGDASPGNLLPGRNADEVVLIDFGFFLPNAVGFDLGQLVGGDVQLGRLPDVPLDELDERCVTAYARGLAAEGCDVPLDVVRRAHALQLFLFSGISSLPDEGMSPEQVAARAALARHSVDLLDRTGG